MKVRVGGVEGCRVRVRVRMRVQSEALLQIRELALKDFHFDALESAPKLGGQAKRRGAFQACLGLRVKG